MASITIRRGAEILGLGFLFRVQEFVLGYPNAPWTDLLRVDILNIIGVSIMLMGLVCWVLGRWRADAFVADGVAASIAMMTPLLWTTWQPKWLSWFLESYINGCHNLGTPQHWLFPIFPWTAFAFAGLAVGFFLMSDWARANGAQAIAVLGGSGVICFGLGWALDALPVHLYRVYDFWHTSPNFFLMRTGVVMMIVLISYVWCRWGAGQRRFSPLIKMGQASLLVYWVHIEFVYGRFSILTKHAEGIAGASAGLLVILGAMAILAALRIRTKGRGTEIAAKFRRKLRPVAEN